jgi:hypothetical protein
MTGPVDQPMYDSSPWQSWTPPAPPPPPRRRHVGAFVTLGALVAGAAAVGAMYGTGVIGGTTARSGPVVPASIVVQPKPPPRDFRDRLVLQRSIHETMSQRAAKDGGSVTPVTCVDIGVRHWECHTSVRLDGQSSALTLDVRVSADFQRWISK